MKELISIITTSYNAEKYIGDTIKSILAQDYNNFEYIIVDDGSTDNTIDIIKSFKDSRIHLIKAGRIGRGKALNVGISKSCGKYIAIQDADDISHPKRLSIEIKCLQKRKEIFLLGTNQLVFYDYDPIDWNEISNHSILLENINLRNLKL